GPRSRRLRARLRSSDRRSRCRATRQPCGLCKAGRAVAAPDVSLAGRACARSVVWAVTALDLRSVNGYAEAAAAARTSPSAEGLRRELCSALRPLAFG